MRTVDGRTHLEPFHLVGDSVFGEGESVLRIAFLGEPGLAAVGIEVERLHGADIGFGHGFGLVKGYLEHLAGEEVTELRLVHGLSLLHAEDVRGEDLVRIPVVFDNFLLGDFVIREYGHGREVI
jgi:hypothetical protein